jgi:hypothetical protein
MTELAATLGGNASQAVEHSDGSAAAAGAAADAAEALATLPSSEPANGAQATAVAAVGPQGQAVAAAVAVAGQDRTLAIARVDQLAARIREAKPGGSKAYQGELARVTGFLPRLRLAGNEDLIDEAEIALGALLRDPPSMVLAGRTNGALRRALWLRSYNPATRMMVGVAILSYFFAFGWLLAGGTILGLDIQSLLGPAVFGWLGSVASMVTRINSFRTVDNPITVGATRPLLGAAFGIFSYLALRSGIVTIGGTDPNPELFIAVAFVAGFSERFVPDLISSVEEVTGGKNADASAEASVKS